MSDSKSRSPPAPNEHSSIDSAQLALKPEEGVSTTPGMSSHQAGGADGWGVEALKRHARALKSARTALMMVDSDFIITYVNDASRELLADNEAAFRSVWPDFKAEDIVGQCVDRFHRHSAHQRKVLANPDNLPFRTDIRIADVILELYVTADVDEAGTHHGFNLEWTDVTEIRRTAARNVEYARQVDAMSRNMAVISFSPDGTILETNDNFNHLMKTSTDIIGQHHRVFCRPELAASPEYAEMWRSLGRGEPLEGEFERVTADGRIVWIQASYVPIRDDNGRLQRLTKFAYDITDAVATRHRISEGVKALLRPMEAASNGNLSSLVTVNGTDAIGRLGTGLQTLLSNLRQSMIRVDGNADGVSEAARTLNDVSQTMERTVSEVAREASDARHAAVEIDHNIQSVSAAAQQMSASITEIATSASSAAEVARSAVQTVSEVKQTVGQLGESSTQIGKVVRMITSIAEQTNLLALNATIEAARAGDAGRGFAVVANEVKELAKNTAVATEDIAQRVAAIRDATDQTVQAIERVAQTIEEISDYQNTIAGAVEEQSATTREIERSMVNAAQQSNGVVSATQRVDAGLMESTQAAQACRSAADELSRMSTDLKNELSQFDLGESPTRRPLDHPPPQATTWN